jgi:NAD(P)-dependent dehydrogenase (short-subunit alcohol dehydrogenase family)
MSTMLITGASRGIGLEHCRQHLAAGGTAIAACRNPEAALTLQALEGERLRIVRMDMRDHASIDAAAQALAGTAIDVLINNAGTYGPKGFPEGMPYQSVDGMDYAIWADVLAVNVLGPFKVTTAFRAHLKASKGLVVMMSSDLGSITSNSNGQSHAYRTSKAALNMLTKGLAIDLAGDGIRVISMAPGWTQTDMGSTAAIWPVDESVRRQRDVLNGLDSAATGCFINLNGAPVPW